MVQPPVTPDDLEGLGLASSLLWLQHLGRGLVSLSLTVPQLAWCFRAWTEVDGPAGTCRDAAFPWASDQECDAHRPHLFLGCRLDFSGQEVFSKMRILPLSL